MKNNKGRGVVHVQRSSSVFKLPPYIFTLTMSRDRDLEAAKVYVGDLGSGGSKPELEKEFERYGPLKSVWVARNPPGESFESCQYQSYSTPLIYCHQVLPGSFLG